MNNENQLGSGPIEVNLVELMNNLAMFISSVLGRDNGFVLMVFPFGQEGKDIKRCNYISNANREDVITLLTEQLSYFKGMPDSPTTEKRQ